MDRVKEPGDTSVPFDVHAIAYPDNAPELENTFINDLKHILKIL